MKNLKNLITIVVLFAALFPPFGGIKGGCQNVGINIATPDSSALLDLTSTEQGLLIPRMTTLQRDAINVSESPNSVMIFNTTTECFEFYYDGSWYEIGCATETFTCGTSTVTFDYSGSSVTYGTVVGQNSTCWLDRNLGASNTVDPADYTGYDDYRGYGDLFQWGRFDHDHQDIIWTN